MAKAGKISSIKYADKSAGQPALVAVFEDLKRVLLKYVKGSYVVKDDLPGNFSVYYDKPVETAGRTYPQIPFAALLIQKGFVGFYFFCVYTEPSLKSELPEALRKLLRGKSCFHFTSSDRDMLKDVDHALTAGYRLYRSKGWK